MIEEIDWTKVCWHGRFRADGVPVHGDEPNEPIAPGRNRAGDREVE